MPRLEELRALCEVIECGSFTLAAERLGISQPAVSLQIKSLETAFGTSLLHRDGFEVVATESGRIVYEYASQIIAMYEKAGQRVRDLKGQVDGTLRVGASVGVGESLLPLWLGEFRACHPQVRIALRVGDSSEIIAQVLREGLELGFVGLSRRDRHLCFEPLIQDELIVVVHAGHSWAARSSISYEELMAAPLIVQQRGSGATEFLAQTLHEHDIDLAELNITMELGLQQSTKVAAMAGFGATIISKLGAMQELERGLLVQVPVDGLKLQRNFYSVYRRTSQLTNSAQAFLEFTRERASSRACAPCPDG